MERSLVATVERVSRTCILSNSSEFPEPNIIYGSFSGLLRLPRLAVASE